MSYYRSPDDLPGGGDPTVADDPAALPAAPSAPSVPTPPAAAPAPAARVPTPIAEVYAGALTEDARRQRKQRILLACVVIDALILVIVLAIFFR